jgi:hypothetical protein
MPYLGEQARPLHEEAGRGAILTTRRHRERSLLVLPGVVDRLAQASYASSPPTCAHMDEPAVGPLGYDVETIAADLGAMRTISASSASPPHPRDRRDGGTALRDAATRAPAQPDVDRHRIGDASDGRRSGGHRPDAAERASGWAV